jgi:hypothetical protein
MDFFVSFQQSSVAIIKISIKKLNKMRSQFMQKNDDNDNIPWLLANTQNEEVYY